jgi:hypothetical protein
MRAPLELLNELARRAPATDVEQWLARGFAKHLDDGLPLNQALGLPGTPGMIRTAMRDIYLVRAAETLGDLRPCALMREAMEFMLYKWPAWQRLGRPPAYATAVQLCLWDAAKAADFPTSHDSYSRILAGLRG